MSDKFFSILTKTLDSTIVEPKDWPTLDEVEAAYVQIVLRYTRGNKQAASRLLNVDRKTIDRMIRRYKLATVEPFVGGDEQKKHALVDPFIVNLGKWPEVQDAIRRLARERGVPPEEIEAFLLKVRQGRAERKAEGRRKLR